MRHTTTIKNPYVGPISIEATKNMPPQCASSPALQSPSFDLVDSQHFHCSTLHEIIQLSNFLAQSYPMFKHLYLGLYEMSINAHEHGNLGITYDEKTHLNRQGLWEKEILIRQAQPENQKKKVTIDVFHTSTEVIFAITDQGNGFAWQDYLNISPQRRHDNHGRGIALSNSIAFDNIHFISPGNRVYCQIFLP